ncbi:alpha-ketoglutarate-dependent dioxygenase alkB homolog 6 isoform X2 [Durio zibethinus]|uniref:Alpha-ketoglutarate-dependent dioxygenase alkB homolog 6 isoform X2 n=1 Tax=Durio zibethinus TaxID=66656 RepID=A0A6P6AN97_DURZI|nr:alpha-ketoglutarate-dependent dioxygenase alkB homolog 6 isoform X2 [Durio zibethinus]
MERKENLNNFIVGDLPTLIYIPDFITDSEQAHLLNNIYQAPVSKWKSLKNRRLQNWGGVVHEKGLISQDSILSLGSPVVMDFTSHSRLKSCKSTLRENVEDKTSNVGAEAVEGNEGMDNHGPFSILLVPRSLLIFKDDAYSDYLHGIEDSVVHRFDQVVNEIEALSGSSSGQAEVVRIDHAKIVNRNVNRISLTCRLVLKVHKNLFKF